MNNVDRAEEVFNTKVIDNLTYIESIISNTKWRFSKTKAKVFPHEYVICKTNNQETLSSLCEYIKRNSHFEYFYTIKGEYCSIGEYTYWITGNVINRRWNDIYKVDETNHIVKVDNWKKLLCDGRIPNAKEYLMRNKEKRRNENNERSR